MKSHIAQPRLQLTYLPEKDIGLLIVLSRPPVYWSGPANKFGLQVWDKHAVD